VGDKRHFCKCGSVNSVSWASHKYQLSEKRLNTIVNAVSNTIEGVDLDREAYHAELSDCLPYLFNTKDLVSPLIWVRSLKSILLSTIAGCKKQGYYTPAKQLPTIPNLPHSDEGRVVGLLLTSKLQLGTRNVFYQISNL
jgi:hypothetical protein